VVECDVAPQGPHDHPLPRRGVRRARSPTPMQTDGTPSRCPRIGLWYAGPAHGGRVWPIAGGHQFGQERGAVWPPAVLYAGGWCGRTVSL
jgi:hypothetical protein